MTVKNENLYQTSFKTKYKTLIKELSRLGLLHIQEITQWSFKPFLFNFTKMFQMLKSGFCKKHLDE